MDNNVRPYPLSDADLAVIICSLTLMDALLFKSRLPTELQTALQKHITTLIDNINRIRQEPIDITSDDPQES